MPTVVWATVTAGVWYAGATDATITVFAVMTCVMCYLGTIEIDFEESDYE